MAIATMGISTILKPKRSCWMAWGNKAPIIARSAEGHVTEQVPASILQQHNDCVFVVDEAASSRTDKDQIALVNRRRNGPLND